MAIAKALGEVLGKKAAKMVELSEKISEAGAGDDKQQAALDSQKYNAEFQATNQEFQILSTAFNTAMKSIGEGMSAMARKQ